MTKPRRNIIGEKYGRLTVVRRVDDYVLSSGRKKIRLECKCDCGNTVMVLKENIVSGNTKSCGCFNSEMSAKRKTTHGGRYERLYKVWDGMKYRCLNESSSCYSSYGGRGITICNEWIESYEAFRKWAIENGYDDKAEVGECTLDRIDVNGNYDPSNCRWITQKQQGNNKRNNRVFTYNGETHTISEWSDIYGISYSKLCSRINKLGWSFERAITTQ